MVLNLATVIGSATPVAFSTFISHYRSKRSKTGLPTSNLSYDEGLALVREFLIFASKNTVEDLQRFTSQWVPHPYSLKVDTVEIPENFIVSAARYLQTQLEPTGIELVGGKTWWQWRKPNGKINAEWIEMRDQYKQRLKARDQGGRVIFYIHGGAFYFGSVAEHRYQLQRYARNINARVFAPTYRLAPQFPFPCGLHDCLAAYLYIITQQDPTTIILSGDSAGGGLILSMMVILRDQGIPFPSGAILISPWVDLTHSFPSIMEDNPFDYIPRNGFFHKPSESWPPAASEDTLISEDIYRDKKHSLDSRNIEGDPLHGNHTNNVYIDKQEKNRNHLIVKTSDSPIIIRPSEPNLVSMIIDGQRVKLTEQIQIYAPNILLPHPLVSPVFQSSLGGLPPLLILVGGGEILRDEQIFLAHKAANPQKYVRKGDLADIKNDVDRWKSTYVKLQVWDDMCHVAPILSFANPVKQIYRSVAQFSYWALHRAQLVKKKTENIECNNRMINSMLNSEELLEDFDHIQRFEKNKTQDSSSIRDSRKNLTYYHNYMIRQRIDFKGNVKPLEPESELKVCNVNPTDLGCIKADIVNRWREANYLWEKKYGTLRRRIEEKQKKKLIIGHKVFEDDENPPPSALVSRWRAKGAQRNKNSTQNLASQLLLK